jgi:hypothetical protein
MSAKARDRQMLLHLAVLGYSNGRPNHNHRATERRKDPGLRDLGCGVWGVEGH